MSDDRHRFRLLAEHVDGSTGYEGWDTYHEWVDLDRPPVYRDAIGRMGNGSTYRWKRLRCNQNECPAEAIYRHDLIEQAASEWEQRRTEGRS